jgi:hypothetical protein
MPVPPAESCLTRLGAVRGNGRARRSDGGGAQSAVAKASGASQPILYVEFRKDGIPVDPGPWWAANEGQKVRG